MLNYNDFINESKIEFGKANTPLMFYNNIEDVRADLDDLLKIANPKPFQKEKIKFLEDVIKQYDKENK